MTLDTAFHLFVGGAWIALPDVDPDISVEPARPSTEFVSLDGSREVWLAARAARSWRLRYGFDDSAQGRWLDYAATNPGEVWLLDVTAAQVNMLDARTTKGAALDAVLVAVENGPQMASFAAGESFTRKVREGIYYHLSYTTTHTAAATIGTYNLGAGPVNIVAPPGTGARRGSVTFLTTEDGDLDVVWTVADKTTAARLTESSVDSLGFLEGRNTPCQVSVSDASLSLNMAFSDRLALADSSYLLREVGGL